MFLLLFICIFIYVFITRGVPHLVSLFIVYKYKVQIQIKRISFPKFNIEDVIIRNSSLTLKIERIKLTSSLLNQDERKLIAFHLYDIRIEAEKNQDHSLKIKKNEEQFLDDLEEQIAAIKLTLPPSVVSLAQFFALRIKNVNVVYFRTDCPECMCHIVAEEVIIEGATKNDTSMAVNGQVHSTQMKILQYSDKKETTAKNPVLMECLFTFKFYFEINCENICETDTISMHLISPELIVQENLINMIANRIMEPSSSVYPSKFSISDFVQKFWFFLPLKFRFKLDGFNINAMNNISQVAVKGSLTNLDLQTHFNRTETIDNFPELLPDFSTEVQFDCLQINGYYESFISLSQMSMQTQFVGDRVNIKNEIRSLNGHYDYKDFVMWFSCLKKYNCLMPVAIKDSKEPCIRYCLGIIFEMWNFDIKVTVPNYSEKKSSSIQILLQHARYAIAITQETTQIAGELLMELISIRLVGDKVNEPHSEFTSKRIIHEYGTVFFAGLFLSQTSCTSLEKNSFPLQIDVQLDNIKIELTNNLGNFIEYLLKYTKNLKIGMKNSKTNCYSLRPNVNSFKGKIDSLNVFIHTDLGVSTVIRVDSLECTKGTKLSKISVNALKLLKTPTQQMYSCIKCEDIKNDWCYLSFLTIDFVESDILVSVSKKVHITWSTTIHMVLFTILKDISDFIAANYIDKSDKTDVMKDLRLQIVTKGDIKIGAVLSPRYSMNIITNDFIYLMADKRISISTPLLKVTFNENEIIVLNEAKIMKTLQSQDVKDERTSFPDLDLKQNVAFKFKVLSCKFTFPYEFNFSEAFFDDFVCIIKWLKKIHAKSYVTLKSASPLPPDIVIQVDKIAAEICDDPFEVKLRYNYELMEDEYQESCKRLKALEQKIEETRKTNLQLISGKLEELYEALHHKNSETYIKRSKKMYSQQPIRTQLFLWEMENVLIYAIADPSYHGREKVVSQIKEIDRESPWPDDGMDFNIVWCRTVSASCSMWKFQLRDYPQSLLHIKNIEIWGRLAGAEQKPLPRAWRSVTVNVEQPWTCVSIERSMTALKFYHDLTLEASTFEAAYGPCWEPAFAQFGLSLNKIMKPSLDPSPPLPWWDKLRIMLHGRLSINIEKMTLLLHASLDPYNTTEEMELTWSNLDMNSVNSNMELCGDLSIYVRTASKYDDARLLHFSNLKINVKIGWVCQGNPNDHHSVMPCAPDKLPEYSSNQEHDSFRVFRSQGVKLNVALETKPSKNEIEAAPIQLLFYGSTLRWFENLKFILSGVSRPTRRGVLFKNTAKRKPQLSRHYESIHLSLSFQRIDVRYWMSVRVKKGFHLSAERLSLSSEHILSFSDINDGLIHRPKANWSICFLNTEACQTQIWLQSVMNEEISEHDNISLSSNNADAAFMTSSPVEKFYFLHLTKVSYMREMLEPLFNFSVPKDTEIRETPNHRLVVHNLKSVWTTSTRDIVFALYDSWNKNQLMKQNLAPHILKDIVPGSGVTPLKQRNWSVENANSTLSPTGLLKANSHQIKNTPSPKTRLQSDQASSMLQQLVAEADNHYVVYANDVSTPEPRDQSMKGAKSACTHDDVVCKTWLIELENSQVLFKSCETEGYVIVSAAHSQICQRIHRPTWKDHSLVTKTTWTGSLECMQYYATVSEGKEDSQMENIMWLTVDNIEEKDWPVIHEVTDIVGSGQSVGGVVSESVGTSDQENESIQLQRIVSRCRCEIFFVSYGETGLDPSLLEEVQPPPNVDDEPWNTPEEPADAFILRHYDLCASTNSLQYNMVLDILNNLLLYVDHHKKEATEALARMRFKLQLYSTDDQRKPIVSLQNKLRYQLSHLRYLEKEIYLIQRQIDSNATPDLCKKVRQYEFQVSDCKEKVTKLSDELAMRIHLYNETQLSCNRKLAATKEDEKEKSLIRMNEIYFRKAQWRLTESDGQLAICQLDLSNFSYSKKTFSDDRTEHLLEIGFINMNNLLPNQIYTNVLAPAELKSSMPVDRQKTLRIYCREKPPIGGIVIIDHLEINVVPLKIGLTDYFIQRMMKFCFPYNHTEEEEVGAVGGRYRGDMKSALSRPHKVSSFYVDLNSHKDQVEIMKQRAEHNKLFVYIKITEVPVDFSYKGKKGSIFSMESTPLLIRTIEYHSVTWTWLDFTMAVKQTSKSLIKQAIRNKLNLPRLIKPDEEGADDDEEKRKIIFGSKYLQQEKKAGKKNLFKSNK